MFVIITADDFGVNGPRSTGILRLAAKGKITHTTAVVNGEVSEEMIRKFMEEKGKASSSSSPSVFICSIGLHFNITEGLPMSQAAKECPALVDPSNGRFRGKAEVFLGITRCAASGSEQEKENLRAVIADELTAQLALFDRFCGNTGPNESKDGATTAGGVWIDGHHHVHILPIVFEVILTNPRLGGMRIPHQHNLVHELSLSTTQRASDVNTRGGDNGALDPQHGVATSLANRFFSRVEDCFGVHFWRSVSTIAAVRRKEVALHTTNKAGNEQDMASHHHVSKTSIATPNGFFGLDIMGSSCSTERVMNSIAEHLSLTASERLTPLVTSSTTSNSSYHHQRNALLQHYASPYAVEIMTHVGYAMHQDDEGTDGGGEKGENNSVAALDAFFHDAFSLSEEREHEMRVYESLVFDVELSSISCAERAKAVDFSSKVEGESGAREESSGQVLLTSFDEYMRKHQRYYYACSQGCSAPLPSRVVDVGSRKPETSSMHIHVHKKSVEDLEVEERNSIERSENVGINAILAEEVSAFLSYKRGIHQKNRATAKTAAAEATKTFIAQHLKECEDRTVAVDADLAQMMSEVTDTFRKASLEVMKADEEDDIREALNADRRAADTRAIRTGRSYDYVRSYLGK